jgi:serine/threonine protein phosphatase 1
MLHKLLRKRPNPPEQAATVPPGQRVYAVGDVHGRLDLLQNLLTRIDTDDGARPAADTSVIILGDLIDRGPDSAGVVEHLIQYARTRPTTRFLLGNHEEILSDALAGSERAIRGFCRVGGRETLISYGVSATEYERMSYADVADALTEMVPAAHIEFLSTFGDSIVIGDYMFVHAGVDPHVSLEKQSASDLRWIREPFLNHQGRLAKLIVHGHTIRPDVEWREHRIGIDTGAYETGRLTALALEGGERWLLQT